MLALIPDFSLNGPAYVQGKSYRRNLVHFGKTRRRLKVTSENLISPKEVLIQNERITMFFHNQSHKKLV